MQRGMARPLPPHQRGGRQEVRAWPICGSPQSAGRAAPAVLAVICSESAANSSLSVPHRRALPIADSGTMIFECGDLTGAAPRAGGGDPRPRPVAESAGVPPYAW